MHVFILCGRHEGIIKSYSQPSPLNMIYTKPALFYILQSLPKEFKIIHFIYTKNLLEYNFETVVINLCKDRQFKFSCIDYFTRGPVESALIGLDKLSLSDEPILFIDNDNIYKFPTNCNISNIKTAFLGYAKHTNSSDNYSFIKYSGDRLINISEKVKISDKYCIGIYGFESISQFKLLATEELLQYSGKECHMCILFRRMLNKNIPIRCVEFQEAGFEIGSLEEIENNLYKINIPKMRVCFDLDNTLVTYPRTPGDYSTVEPIHSMIQLAKRLHSEGHTIIIHTARRMATHKHNLAAVIKDIGKITFDTLEQFEIPYDEILFGKPIADIYIDDKSVNPYFNNMKSMGIFQYEERQDILNMCLGNKHNNLKITKNNEILKKGTKALLKGQAFFYRNIPPITKIEALFPKLLHASEDNNNIELYLEYLKGIPLSYLLEYKLFTDSHIDRLIEILDMIHNTNVRGEQPTIENIKRNYREKFITRLENTSDYPFDDRENVRDLLLQRLDKYLESEHLSVVEMIHGDFWLSNMILLFDGSIKLIDMRGQVDDILTLGGDPLYDYAKLYQSLLGYDLILYGKEYDKEYLNKLVNYFEYKIDKIGLNKEFIKSVSLILLTGTFFAIDSKERKDQLWKWIKTLI